MVMFLTVASCGDATAPLGVPDEAGVSAQLPTGPVSAARFARGSSEVMALPGTVFAARDEATGELVFGVEHPAVANDIAPVLARAGVPKAAYRVQVTEPIRRMSTLRDEHASLAGGVQIHWRRYLCTLGFSVDHAGGRSFITNSHCTEKQGSTRGTEYHQPNRSVSPEPIGVEADDPSYFRGGECSRGKVCRFSDAARVVYEEGVASRARIAKTSGENDGSVELAGHFTIASQNNNSTTFSGTVHKMGRTTGWSSGDVTHTCARVNVERSNIQLLCQTIVENSGTRIVDGGDSGSPVFTRGTGDDIELVGIVWGGDPDGDLFVFSPFSAIQNELGSMDATTDGVGGPGGDEDGGGDDDRPNCPPTNNNPRCS